MRRIVAGDERPPVAAAVDEKLAVVAIEIAVRSFASRMSPSAGRRLRSMSPWVSSIVFGEKSSRAARATRRGVRPRSPRPRRQTPLGLDDHLVERSLGLALAATNGLRGSRCFPLTGSAPR